MLRSCILTNLCVLASLGAADRAPVDWVNPLVGTDRSVLPKAEGIVNAWWNAKPGSGNTHPGPTIPHGMVSATPYADGYPSGYKTGSIIGFSHFQQSGSGNLRLFYNFVLVMPRSGEPTLDRTAHPIANETAVPGCYGAKFGTTDIRGDITVTQHAAVHRYTFPTGKPAHLVIDLTTSASEKKMSTVRADRVELTSTDPRSVAGAMTFRDQPTIYFHLVSDLPGSELRAWSGKTIEGALPKMLAKPGDGGGVVFSAPAAAGPVHLKIGFSLRSTAQAKANLEREIPAWDFAGTAATTKTAWAKAMSRITVEGGSDQQRSIFFTALYHTLIKPIDLTNESPFWSDDKPLYLDIATIWDSYKNQFPMFVSFYPETGAGIINSLIATMAHFDFDHPTRLAYMIHNDQGTGFHEQGAGIAHQVVLEAWYAGLPGIDWAKAYPVLRKAMGATGGKRTDLSPKHILDDSYTSFLMAGLAKGQGDGEGAAMFLERSKRWPASFDPSTAQLKGILYEGKSQNYSWQVWHDLPALIAMHGGINPALVERDAFFGFTGGAKGSTYEGLNNQADMDAFISYYHLGRPDRAVDVARAVLAYRFATGRGGLPGNDDNGGTSAWYVTNAIGLQPLCGSGRFYIGSPIFTRTTITLGTVPLVIETSGASEANRYVVSATWRGKPLEVPYLEAADLRHGGKLVLTLGAKAVAWMKPLP